MDTDHRYRAFETARVRAELTVQELWLRYLALGGAGDVFDIDGYLNGLLPLETSQQDILAVALNERLDELYQAVRIPLSTPAPHIRADDLLPSIVRQLLGEAAPPPEPTTE